ncbi:MAG: phosphatidylglycerol lysyltransferase domain-containing protein [Nitrospirota bacterium]
MNQTDSKRPGTLIPVIPLPQYVPSRACFQCDVCCRFPEPDSFLRPYFTREEIQRAVAHGVGPSQFPDPAGCQVALVPNPVGEGYLCPAFDHSASRCRIYEARPLDCQLYPLAVMWSADRSQVVLGWDTKCPFLQTGEGRGVGGEGTEFSPLPRASGPVSELEAYADRIADLIERDETRDIFAGHPRLVGRFQEDVVVVKPLPKLTERLVRREGHPLHFSERRVPGVKSVPPSSPITHHPSPITLHPLELADRPRFEQAMRSFPTPLAAYAFAPHFIWRSLLTYSWTEIAGQVCLFAEYGDGFYMPLPPLPAELGTGREARGTGCDSFLWPSASNLAPILSACFKFMRKRNRGSAVTRVENVSEELKPVFESLGYPVKPKDPDYLYRTADLAGLKGDRYKSQRAACNRVVRTRRVRYGPYEEGLREECLALFRQWTEQKRRATHDPVARQMLADAEAAHREAFAHHRALGLVGRVARVDGVVRAYTFGFERSPSVFCVLLEVADRTLPGLAQFLFRESCRETAALGYEFVNTMDDSGLPSLARSKRDYHPVRLVPSFIATES